MNDRLDFGKLWAWLSGLGLIKREGTDEGTYWTYLSDLPIESLHAAFMQAPGKLLRWFPTASELRAMAIAHRDAERAAAVPPPTPSKWVDPELATDNPFVALACEWEKESRDLGIGPDKPSPRHIARRRFREINELFGSCCHDLNEVVRDKPRTQNQERVA